MCVCARTCKNITASTQDDPSKRLQLQKNHHGWDEDMKTYPYGSSGAFLGSVTGVY